ncbi:Metallo-dependent phosphatase-like protein [Apiospora kogelbergensis]|uniref:Metallo-dependent phosphatase-like protein n=1 Tax=Apiospora kogelbergensis TaxID=1337665 RepID=A0AAW0Q396_9PEZI
MSEFQSLLQRPRPSAWDRFRRRPCVYLAEKLHARHQHRLPTPPSPSSDAGAERAPGTPPRRDDHRPVSVVCISDTHNSNARCDPLPPGDVLIHAGDLTQAGSPAELQAAIVVGGNHDVVLDPARSDEQGREVAPPATATTRPAAPGLRPRRDEVERACRVDWGDVRYLHDSAAWIAVDEGRRRLKVWGSAWTPRNGNWAYQYPREQGAEVWYGAVPDDVDILVTHGPPRGHLDADGHSGCDDLLREVWRVVEGSGPGSEDDALRRGRHGLRLHVFGHVHAGRGHEWVAFDSVQRAYERTVSAGGGVWNLSRLVWASGTAALSRCFSAPAEAKCQMVNAAMVGGLRDVVQHRPIKVYV